MIVHAGRLGARFCPAAGCRRALKAACRAWAPDPAPWKPSSVGMPPSETTLRRTGKDTHPGGVLVLDARGSRGILEPRGERARASRHTAMTEGQDRMGGSPISPQDSLTNLR